jgi:hypothetical protein
LPVREGQVFFTRTELRAGFTQNHWRLECSDPAAACTLLGPELAALDEGQERLLLAAGNRDEAAALIERLVRAGHKIYHLEATGRSLDDVTLQAMREEKAP